MTTAIKLDRISKQYPGIKALDEISFEVSLGSVHGFLGPNGAGKSTTMKILVGLLSASEGQIEFFGDKKRPPIGYLSEVPPLYPSMRVRDYLSFIAQINGNASKRMIFEAIDRCGLSAVSNRLIGNLSKGYKQRVGIAQALVYEAPLVILDEPMAGLDPASIQEIRALIQELAVQRTILFSSHQLHDVNLVCNEVTIINRGRIIQSGPLESLERKFQSNQVLQVAVERWNDDLEVDLRKQLQCESITAMANERTTTLRLFLSGQNDSRADLSRFFVEKGCGLLEINEQKIDLEEIFALSMKEDMQ